MEDHGTPERFIGMNLEDEADLAAFRAVLSRRAGRNGGAGGWEEVLLTGATGDGLGRLADWGRRRLEDGCIVMAKLMPRDPCRDDNDLEDLNPVAAEGELAAVLEAAWENREGYGMLELSVMDDDPARMDRAAGDLMETAAGALAEGDPLLSPEVLLQNTLEAAGNGELEYTDRNELRLHLRRPDLPAIGHVVSRGEDIAFLDGEDMAFRAGEEERSIPRMEIGLGEAYGDLNRN